MAIDSSMLAKGSSTLPPQYTGTRGSPTRIRTEVAGIKTRHDGPLHYRAIVRRGHLYLLLLSATLLAY